ncbi:glutamate--tRNA ligase [Methanobacterium alcaliphilum]|uniref:glutamate--tRNA ligase n=1 Tax=Methanobacterium alcaliphilum TaxID=392018 RepID=UPI00200B982E|nr:glutamate--tRNA ligase [Methanobacterium alcaliphilum]MCK9151359.1 glutamate--tRNA ligase [Methanobacterium alcaliphilum]
MNDLEKVVYKYALINAVKHNGKAHNGAVIGSIMSNESELRREAKTISKLAGEIVEKVNAMDPQKQIAELEKTGGQVEEKKKVEEKGLGELPEVKDNVVLRFAPNPSGPLHIGHARAAVLNSEYAKKYNGKLVLRIEDTDPRRVHMDAYEMIPEDLSWMGVECNETFIQSDRIPIYYEYAQKAIEIGAAYMCTCDGGDFKKLKDEKISCPCRDLPIEENLRRWEEMFALDQGSVVLRIKTDIKHKNPAIRDWVAMRIVEDEHPRIGKKYKVYPMMNFSVAVDDHLMGVTHVLRGKDHLANSEKQEYLYNHMGWEIPVFIHYGRLKMDDVALSTSQARAGIEDGTYSGWDDPRLGTIRAIARRGIQADAIKELMSEIGVKIADATISWKKVYGLNRNILEETANRYFFVADPEKIVIQDVPESAQKIVERPLHPDFLDRGDRKIPFNGKVYLSKDDLKMGKIIRLMDAVNVKVTDNGAIFHSESFEEARSIKAQAVQWVPVDDNVPVEIVMDDASIIKGCVEPAARLLKVEDEVQLERFGFARVDEINKDKIRFYFTHK